MITLVIFAVSFLASCIAAAGLIASTQNAGDAARAMAGIEIGQD